MCTTRRSFLGSSVALLGGGMLGSSEGRPEAAPAVATQPPSVPSGIIRQSENEDRPSRLN